MVSLKSAAGALICRCFHIQTDCTGLTNLDTADAGVTFSQMEYSGWNKVVDRRCNCSKLFKKLVNQSLTEIMSHFYLCQDQSIVNVTKICFGLVVITTFQTLDEIFFIIL
jgi:hypothetical protein